MPAGNYMLGSPPPCFVRDPEFGWLLRSRLSSCLTPGLDSGMSIPRCIISLLTLLSLVLHCALGCCWHHAYSTTCLLHETRVEQPIGYHPARCSHSADCDDHASPWWTAQGDVALLPSLPDNDHHEREHGDCDEEACRYLPPHTVKPVAGARHPPASGLPVTAENLATSFCHRLQSANWQAGACRFSRDSACARAMAQVWIL